MACHPAIMELQSTGMRSTGRPPVGRRANTPPGADRMDITLNIDNNRNDTTAGARLERISRMRETVDRSDQQAATRSWTREDLYDRPYHHYYDQ